MELLNNNNSFNNDSFIEIPIFQLITELHWVLNQDIELYKRVKLIPNLLLEMSNRLYNLWFGLFTI